MLLALFLTLLVILPCSASEEFQKIGFKDCKSSFKITDVQASGCTVKDAGNNKKLCEFQAGTTPKIRITFNSDEMAPSLTAQIKAKIGETFLEFPMADNDACQSGISCPIEVGKTYTYEKGIEIINNYPKDETVQVNWMLNKNGKEKGICIVFLVRIVV